LSKTSEQAKDGRLTKTQRSKLLPNAVPSHTRMSAQFLLLAVFLAVVFVTGGSSRSDEIQVAILLPISLIVCAFAVATLRREHFAKFGILLLGFGVVFVLALAHLVPVPPGLRQIMPEGALIASIETAAGMEAGWRPLALFPVGGWQALISLATPLALCLLGVQLSKHERLRMLPLLIVLASASGLIGLLQAIGDPSSPLYLYRVTNNGSAVGLFANRNHAATLLACIFPMLAVYASGINDSAGERRRRQLLCVAVALVVVPLVLVTGSRSGLLSAALGLLGAAALYRRPEKVDPKSRHSPKTFAVNLRVWAALVVVGMGLITVYFSRATAVDRLFGHTSGDDGRTDFLVVSADLFWQYLPWGSGSGSFAEAYKIAEPPRLLDPSYLNHAHNDWVETAVVFGAPGLLVLAIVIIAYGYLTYRLWRHSDPSRSSVTLARMASVAIAIIAIASISDYPLRSPILMSVMALLTIMFLSGDSKTRLERKD
jgi:O-antigen ligase